MSRARTVALALLVGLGRGEARAGNDTYCVGAHGDCSSDAIVAQHARWHFHTFVTDGDRCYECFDERDNTCETDFLTREAAWKTVGLGRCLALTMAPPEAGVRFHVIAGREVAAPAPTPAAPVTVSPEIRATTPGPYAIGDSVTMRVRLGEGSGRRAFEGGELIIRRHNSHEIVARVPVTMAGPDEAAARWTPPVGTFAVTFEPTKAGLRAGETLGPPPDGPLLFEVGACPYRARVMGNAAILQGGERWELEALVQADDMSVPAPGALDGVTVELLLEMDDGLTARFPARVEGDRIRGVVIAPTLGGASLGGRVSIVGGGAPPICPLGAHPVTVARLPFAVQGVAPERCWTGQECLATFTVGVGEGPAAAKARALLADPSLEVIATIGGERVPFVGSAAGGTITLRTTPAREGRVSFAVELVHGADSVLAEVAADVAEAIALRLPAAVELGALQGGGAVEATCVPLDFSAGAGAMGAEFRVALAEPCGECAVELVSVTDGLVYSLPLDIQVGRDQSFPLCARVSRCPTGESGAEARLLITPTEPRFADQATEVRVRWRVQGVSRLACWSWLLWWIAGAIGLVFVILGFVRPLGFPPGASLVLASDLSRLRRAGRLLLEEQPGGRRGWYRSARVRVDAGGAATRRRREAAFTVVPLAGGIGIVAPGGVLRQDRRSHGMEAVERAPGESAVPLQRGRIYQVGGLVLRVGS